MRLKAHRIQFNRQMLLTESLITKKYGYKLLQDFVDIKTKLHSQKSKDQLKNGY